MDDLERDVSFDFCAGIGGDDIHLNSYDILRALDPVASNRIHPNDQRKINNYLRLYSGSGILPSKLLQGRASENWGRACNLRYDCCFLCIGASFPTLDRYVNERVDHMVRDGLLEEVYDVYNPKADYTRSLLQAIGVREFQDFLKFFLSKHDFPMAIAESDAFLKHKLKMVLDVCDSELKDSLIEAIKRMKLNMRRLVRRQKRRLNQLMTFFGWNLHYIDASETFFSEDKEYVWCQRVVSCETIVKSFLHNHASLEGRQFLPG